MLVFLAIAIMLIMVGSTVLILLNKKKKFKLGRVDSFGSDRMPSAEEARRIWHPREKKPNALKLPGVFYCGTQGDQSIEDLYIPWETICRGVITYGRPGSGKTVSIILRAIINYMSTRDTSLVIVDPKGGIWRKIVALGKFMKVPIKIFDLTDPRRTVSWNMLAGIGESLHAQEIAKMLIKPPEAVYNLGLQAQDLLAAAILHYRSFPFIMQALNDGSINREIKGSSNPLVRDLAAPYFEHLESTKSDVAGTVKGLMRTGLSPLIDRRTWAALTDAPSPQWKFEPLELVNGLEAGIIVLKYEGMSENAIGPFMGVAFSQILQTIYAEGRSKGKIQRPVLFVIDELYLLGALPNFSQRVSDMREFGLGLIAAQQMVSQTDDIYEPAQAEIVRSAFCTNICYAGADPKTAEWMSSLSGETTVELERSSFQVPIAMRTGFSEQEQGRRNLLLRGQIMQPPVGNCTMVLPIPARDRQQTDNLCQHYFFANIKPVLDIEGVDVDEVREETPVITQFPSPAREASAVGKKAASRSSGKRSADRS